MTRRSELSRRTASGSAAFLAFVLASVGCTGDDPGADAASSDTADSPPRILSAYHGLDELPPGVALICGAGSIGEDGLPVVFSVQLDEDSVTPASFAVETNGGERVTPLCATLQPAVETLERRTVLLAGPFGTSEAPPRAVEVAGAVLDVAGASVEDLRTEDITLLEAGPSLVLAERFDPDTPGLAGECPEETLQVVQLTWEGGVSGPDGAALAEAQRTAVSFTLDNGDMAAPIALADDDPDNHVLACLDEASPAQSVTVSAGTFHDPGDDANPETTIEVTHGAP